MPNTRQTSNSHRKAASHYEKAAIHHRMASKHQDTGNSSKASHHAHAAHGHSLQARSHANKASKEHAMDTEDQRQEYGRGDEYRDDDYRMMGASGRGRGSDTYDNEDEDGDDENEVIMHAMRDDEGDEEGGPQIAREGKKRPSHENGSSKRSGRGRPVGSRSHA